MAYYPPDVAQTNKNYRQPVDLVDDEGAFDPNLQGAATAALNAEQRQKKTQLGWEPRTAEQDQSIGPLEMRAARDVDMANRVAQSDPNVAAARQRGMTALGQIDPAQYDQSADYQRNIADSVGTTQMENKARELDARGRQTGVVDQWGRLASGQDSYQQAATRYQTERQAKQIASQYAGQRGAFNAANQRSALTSMTDANLALRAQGAAAQAQERRAALEQQGTQANHLRSADQTMGENDANIYEKQSTIMNNATNTYTAGNEARKSIYAAGYAEDQAAQKRYDDALDRQHNREGSRTGTGEMIMTAIPVIGQAAGTAFALPGSDKKLKEKIVKQEGKETLVSDFLAKLVPYAYHYKPKYQQMGQAKGQQVGIMAQDLQRSEVGKQLIANEKIDGKMAVDYSPNKLGPIVLAALSLLDKRITNLSKKAGK